RLQRCCHFWHVHSGLQRSGKTWSLSYQPEECTSRRGVHHGFSVDESFADQSTKAASGNGDNAFDSHDLQKLFGREFTRLIRGISFVADESCRQRDTQRVANSKGNDLFRQSRFSRWIATINWISTSIEILV